MTSAIPCTALPAAGNSSRSTTEGDSAVSFGGGGIVTNINTFGGTGALHQWAGLTAAPQNLDVNNDGLTGDLNDCLFAITTSGDIYCIDTDGRYTGIGGNPGTPGVPGLISYIPGLNGNPSTPIFPTINGVVTDHVSTGLQNASGLAFSPVDYNLWHPTELGVTDPGHGINPAPDNSRDVFRFRRATRPSSRRRQLLFRIRELCRQLRPPRHRSTTSHTTRIRITVRTICRMRSTAASLPIRSRCCPRTRPRTSAPTMAN